MNEARARPPRRRDTARWWIALVVVALCGGVWLVLRARRPLPPPPVVAMPAQTHAPAPANRPPPVSPPAGAQTIGKNGLLPGDDPQMTDEQRYLGRMAETRAVFFEKTRYPVNSRPLATKTDLLMPHHVEPTFRGLSADPNRGGKVRIEQQQDRLYLSPGQPAIVYLTAMLDGSAAAIEFQRADLVRHVDGQADTVVGTVTFHDDGTPPDQAGSDGTWTAAVAPPSDSVPGDLTLTVDVSSNGDHGTLLYSFVQTDSPPAVFTQSARDALEQGSIAIYVGVQVERAGTYEIQGRLYDSTGAPLVYMRFLDTLTTDSTEVRLLAFGKVILDEGGVPPFVLRDVEGWRMLLGQFPDREMMQDWPAGYTTAAYPLSQLSAADYDGADKQQKLKALDQATQDGVANIRNGAPPAVPGAVAPPHP